LGINRHLTTIRHTELRKYEKPGLRQQLVDIMGYLSFLPTMYTRIFSQREITFLYSSQVEYKDSN